MVLHLAERLEIPLRERNQLLVAAGFAPIFAQRALDDPALEAARQAVDLVLAGHEPFPALAVDRHWTLVAANGAVGRLLAGADPAQLAGPVNVLRLSLHPAGLAPRIANLREWRDHLLSRLRRQIELTADPVPYRPGPTPVNDHEHAGVIVPFRLETAAGLLELFSTTTIFGTPIDVTLSELAIEAFYPADAATGERLRRLAAGP